MTVTVSVSMPSQKICEEKRTGFIVGPGKVENSSTFDVGDFVFVSR